MRLYHASKCMVENPDVYHSREHLDFGRGFYLTSLYNQARKYACRFLLRNPQAYINVYELDDDFSGFNVKLFTEYNEEWLDFVCNCRKGVMDDDIDVVEGGIADDRVFNTLDLYISGIIGKKEALGRLVFEHPNHQICILNQRVLDEHLHFIESELILR